MELSSKDPRNPRLRVLCPHCELVMVYLGTFSERDELLPQDPDTTHVYQCQKHGKFWLRKDVGLKAALS